MPACLDYMEDQPAKENPPKDFNKLDLSQLQGFSFGTSWAQDKTGASDRRDHGDRPARENREGGDRRDAPRDRRAFRKPAGPMTGTEPARPAEGAGAPSDRRNYGGDRRQPGDRRDAPNYSPDSRRDGPGGGGRYGGRNEQMERGPYESPHFSATFYPEDTSFNALAKTIRSSCRTIELFEIARTVIDKLDRFVVVLTRRAASADAKPAPISISVPDGLPFETEDSAIAHVLSTHLDKFFDKSDVEIDPPKGNFLVINKCTITGELLGPPNYHRYNQLVQQHFAAKIRGMSLEAYRNRIETIRDPEVVAQWLEKMKKTTRYTWKVSSKPAKAAAAQAAATPAVESATAAAAETATSAPEAPASTEATAGVPAADVPAADATPAAASAEAAPVAETPAASTSAEPAADKPAAQTFDNFEEARTYLLTQARDKVVRQSDSARFHGKIAESLPDGEIRRAVEGALERQRRFPLDTANALRGRLRREHFTIFKKGSKGVSYVCAVKRKFRVPGQTFAESISALITFIESHPMVKASELSAKFLGIDLPAAPKPADTSAPAGDASTAAPEAAKAEPVLSIDQRAKLSRMQGDLRWLVTEGYVTEFIDGRLFAPPAMVEARKKEVESEEHDPENFPDAPPADAAHAPAPVVPPLPEPETIAELTPAPVPAAPQPEGADSTSGVSSEPTSSPAV
ncbi:MAG: hypothetical protein ABIZ04_03310 [Opitutus sp.]